MKILIIYNDEDAETGCIAKRDFIYNAHNNDKNTIINANTAKDSIEPLMGLKWDIVYDLSEEDYAIQFWGNGGTKLYCNTY